MAESANILTKLPDLLVYLIPQLNKFPRDQKFVLGDRIETKLLDVQEDCLGAYYGRDKRGYTRAASSTCRAPKTKSLSVSFNVSVPKSSPSRSGTP
jgi:hypothetical protein